MSEQTLSVALQGATGVDSSDYVLIDQEEWGKDVGRTSLPQGILAIGAMAFGGILPLPNCGGFEGFNTPVYAYPSRKDLPFKFGISHGEYGTGSIQALTRTEIINCGLRTIAETEYPVQSMQSMVWIGPCFDEKGNIAPRPDVTQDGRTLRFSGKILGSLRITYSVYRIAYNVRIEKREYSLENNFESVAYAAWNGGISSKDLSVPSGYEYTEGECDDGKYPDDDDTVTTICPPPHGSYPTAVQTDRNTVIDYCSQITKKDSLIERIIRDSEGRECE